MEELHFRLIYFCLLLGLCVFSWVSVSCQVNLCVAGNCFLVFCLYYIVSDLNIAQSVFTPE